MPTPEQRRKLLKAKLALALRDELGRVPKREEIDRAFLLTRATRGAAASGPCPERRDRKESGRQLALFP
ncbi:MAG TPA: hypothetical protein VFY87_06610 [Geminicoccaceae bacterium]|nr:hypothetical protein [Geminicoccaceae bacterium]